MCKKITNQDMKTKNIFIILDKIVISKINIKRIAYVYINLFNNILKS